jgi:hypothetical protein
MKKSNSVKNILYLLIAFNTSFNSNENNSISLKFDEIMVKGNHLFSALNKTIEEKKNYYKEGYYESQASLDIDSDLEYITTLINATTSEIKSDLNNLKLIILEKEESLQNTILEHSKTIKEEQDLRSESIEKNNKMLEEMNNLMKELTTSTGEHIRLQQENIRLKDLIKIQEGTINLLKEKTKNTSMEK